jgi:hypothetical protein
MARLGFRPPDFSHFSKCVLMNDNQRNIASTEKLRMLRDAVANSPRIRDGLCLW